MKETKKYHNLIDFCFLILPLLLFALATFRGGAFDLQDIESTFSIFRQYDFGLSNYILHYCFNDTSNTMVLLIFDLSLYHLYFMVFNFAVDLFGYAFQIITLPLEKLTRGLK